METDSSSNTGEVARVRKFDWRLVIKQLDEMPAGTTVLVGIMDQSIRTHIRNGRIKYIDPDKYDIWTEVTDGHRTQARLFMRKR
jgi:hypothetical protein